MIEKAIQTMRDYAFDRADDPADDDPDSPYREVANPGKMPFKAQYDFDFLTYMADRQLEYLQRRGTATDADLAKLVDLDRLAQSCKIYDPDQARREAARERTGRDSTEYAQKKGAETRAEHQLRLQHNKVGPVLSTNENVEWVGSWRFDESQGVDDPAGVLDGFDLPNEVRQFAEALREQIEATAGREDRGVHTRELLRHTTVRKPARRLDRPDFDTATELVAKEFPGVIPPERCESLTWADADASWIYLPAQDEADEREVAHV